MKILQVNCVYKQGSTGKIVYDIHTQLQYENQKSIVCYGRGKKIIEENVYKICGEFYAKFNKLKSMISGIMYGGCIISTLKLIRIILKEQPDIVHLHCINGNFVNIYYLINFLKKKHIKTVLTLHAEFMYTGGCSHSISCNKWNDINGCRACPQWREEINSLFFDRTHTMWKKMYKAFEGFENNLIIISVSPWLMERAKISSILKKFKHYTIFNGLDCEIFKFRNIDKLKKEYNLTNEKIIFHVTPKFDNSLENIKGGYYVLKLAEELRNERIKIFVAGSYDKSIEVPNNIVLLGQITEQKQLAKFYSLADVTILTSKRETFSMVVAESLCCGTPVVGFKAGAPEQITLKEYSEFSEFGNIKKLKENILKWLDKKVDRPKISEEALFKYSKDKMANQYIKVYEEHSNG